MAKSGSGGYTAKIPHPKRGQHIKHVSNMQKRLNVGQKFVKPKNVSGTGRPKGGKRGL